MKVLIVDDNVAIQEIIAEILTVDGYEVELASTIDDAISKVGSFKPEAILLDSVVDGKSSLRVLDSLGEDSDVRALILTNGKEQLPKDTPFIFGFIQKPFKSSEILEKVRSLSSDAEIRHMKGKRSRFKLFSRTVTEKSDEDMGLRFGKSYVVFENEPEAVYKMATFFTTKNCDIMVVTSGRSKSVTERFKDIHVKVLGLSMKPRIGYIEMSKLGTLMGAITEFIDEAVKPVVVIDDLERIIDVNGLNTVLTMIYQIINGGSKKIATLVISVKEESLTDKDKELLLHDMELYEA
ncbi:MAG: response regulator [Candidatus Methanomethylophilaceae archaeon]